MSNVRGVGGCNVRSLSNVTPVLTLEVFPVN